MKTITDTFDQQSSQESVINPTIKDRDEEKTFIATNFKTVTFSPRGFIHIDTLDEPNKSNIRPRLSKG